MAQAAVFNPGTKRARTKQKDPKSKSGVNWLTFGITILVGVVIWFIPEPEGVDLQAWHLFAIFVATIVGLIAKPVPMGVMAMIGITATVLTGTLELGTSLSGFSNTTIWLIVMAFFISRGFIKTGLGSRVAYIFVDKFGKKTLGLSYALAATDLILSPAMPSNTARAGGIVYPIMRSLCSTFKSEPGDGSGKRIGEFLHLSAFQADMITSAMFLTAMAANPLAAQLAGETAGIEITWVGWALAAIVPGIISLIVVPLVIYKINPPEVKETPDASAMAKAKLAEMGPITRNEKLMIVVFIMLIALWITGSTTGLNATTAAFIGLCVLLLASVLTWDDVKSEKGAWDTLVWFAALVMMATQLNTLGLIPWFSELVGASVAGMNWVVALLVLAIAYFFSHYFFASATAHVSAMYAAFLAVAVAAGAPPMLAALILAFFSNLMGCLTHYGSGPAPVFFGSGYVTQGKWWANGFIVAIVDILIWVIVGGLWWKVLGLW